MQDGEEIVFAFAGWDKASGDSISVYWNSDGDKSTGRFKNNYGSDIQLNITPGRNILDGIIWKGDKERTSPVIRKDDYKINMQDGVIFVSLKKNVLGNVKIADKSSFWIVLANREKRIDSVNFRYASKASAADSFLLRRMEKNYDAPSFPANPPAGKGHALPLRYTATSRNIAPGQFDGIGIFENGERLVLGLGNWPEGCTDSLLIIWISDNDKSTGRFPGNVGGDIQFNLNPAKKYLQVVRWFDPANKRQIAFYPDDYLVEEKNGIIFFAIRKGALTQLPMKGKGNFYINRFSVSQQRLDSVTFDCDSDAKAQGYLPSRIHFLRFGSLNSGRVKSNQSIKLNNTGNNITVWSCSAERFQRDEKTPAFTGQCDAFELKAAAGEKENLFFAVESASGVTGLEVIPAPFVSEQGTVSADNIVIRYADYVEEDRGSFNLARILHEGSRA